jgi:hypothetical protein
MVNRPEEVTVSVGSRLSWWLAVFLIPVSVSWLLLGAARYAYDLAADCARFGWLYTLKIVSVYAYFDTIPLVIVFGAPILILVWAISRLIGREVSELPTDRW